jgi:uncharacterized alpha-E superfamily protein
MSRYVERAENTARILNVNLQLGLDAETRTVDGSGRHWSPIINTLEDHELYYSIHAEATADDVSDYMTFAEENPNSIRSCLAFARENARTVREQTSPEMWEQLNKLYLFMNSDQARQLFAANPYEFYRGLIEGSYLFQGITDTTMPLGEGQDFIRVGKFIERADYTSRILDMKYHILLPSGERVGGAVDIIQWMAVLNSCSASEAYRRHYVDQIAPWKVAEFLVINEAFPRSILFCVAGLDRALHDISGAHTAPFTNEAERLSGTLRYQLAYSTVATIFADGLHEFLDGIQLNLIEIAKAIQEQYCEVPSNKPDDEGTETDAAEAAA